MIDGRIRSVAAYTLSFLVVVALFLISVMWSGIYPFGDRSFLAGDLIYQYVDFFTWFQDVLMGSGSLFYSPSQELGSNAWGLYSYYLGSPLNLLILFFPKGAITEFVLFVTALKLGLIQTSAVFFLRKRFDLSFAWCSMLALGFTFSSWTMTQLCNPEWLDVLIFLPLAAWGTHELIRKKREAFLVVSVAGAIACCWYTGYMLIVFMILYFLFELWVSHSEVQHDTSNDACDRLGSMGSSSRTSVLQCVFRFALSLIGALMLSAWTFIPAVLAMMQAPSPVLDIAPAEPSLVSRALAGLESHSALVVAFCAGGALLIAALLYIALAKRFTAKTKYVVVIGAALLVFLIACAGTVVFQWSMCEPVDFIEGFLPDTWTFNQVPQLYAGALILLLCVVFFLSASVPLRLKAGAAPFLLFLLLSVFCAPLYTAWCGFKIPNGFYCRISFVALFFMTWLAAYCVARDAFSLGKLSVRLRKAITAVLFIAVACDLLFSVHSAWDRLYVDYSQEYHEGYVAEAEAEQHELEVSDSGIYRVAKDYTRAGSAALNEGMARGYKELSSYSSAHDENAVAFLNGLGYSKVGEFSTRYAYPILASDSLLGVKYVYSINGAEGFVSLEEAQNSAGARLYENPFALSLGYAVSDNATGITFEDTEDPFQRQNLLINGFTGEDIDPYVPCMATEVERTDASITYDVRVPAGCLGYAFVLDAGEEASYLIMDGREPFAANTRFQDSVYGIAEQAAYEQIVQVTLTAQASYPTISEGAKLNPSARCVFAALDMARFNQAHSMLSKDQIDFEAFSGNWIKGSVEMERSGLAMVSVPASSGWTVTVNGEAVEVVPLAGGALIGIPVQQGVNMVTMSFTPPGLIVGIIVSCVALMLLMVVSIREHKFLRRGGFHEQ